VGLFAPAAVDFLLFLALAPAALTLAGIFFVNAVPFAQAGEAAAPRRFMLAIQARPQARAAACSRGLLQRGDGCAHGCAWEPRCGAGTCCAVARMYCTACGRPCTPGLPVHRAAGPHAALTPTRVFCGDLRDGLARAVRLRTLNPARARSCWRWACTRRPPPSWSSRPRWRWGRARARPSRSARTRPSLVLERLQPHCALACRAPLGPAAGHDDGSLAVCQAQLPAHGALQLPGAAAPSKPRQNLTARPVGP